jgi:hypothetical protein
MHGIPMDFKMFIQRLREFYTTSPRLTFLLASYTNDLIFSDKDLNPYAYSITNLT